MPGPRWKLTGRLEDLARYLEARRGQFVPRSDLLVNVFGHKADSKSRTVDTHIQRLLDLWGDQEEIAMFRSRLRSGFILISRPQAGAR